MKLEDTVITKKLQRVLNQLAGIPDKNKELLPEMIIRGSSGYIMCYDITSRSFIKVARGTTCFMIDETLDPRNRVMVYVSSNNVVMIDRKEIFYVGYN